MSINFCPIVPTSMNNYLLDFKDNMVLAQRYKYDAKYREFMLENRKHWDFLILDNGAAEQSQLLLPELVDICKALKPTVVVAPDSIGDKDGTFTKTELFIRLHKSTLAYDNVLIGAVPQGRTTAEWYESYQELVKWPGVDWICISKYAPCRTALLASDLIINCDKPIHLLGLFNPVEISYAIRWPLIQSIDSQIPISYGYHATRMPVDFGDKGKLPTDPHFFELSTPGEMQYDFIQENVRLIQELCKGSVLWT